MDQLHILFFPFLAPGHMIPTLEMAKLFSSRGVKTTILTTQFYAPVVTKTIDSIKDSRYRIGISVIEFPAVEVGLPEECQSMDKIRSDDMLSKFFKAVFMLQEPFERVLQELSPDCVVADMFFTWATDVAAKFDIPRLVFHGISLFSLCTSENLGFYKPFKNVSSDSEPFVLPHFPNEIQFTKAQLPEFEVGQSPPVLMELLTRVKESEVTSYGMIVNSYDELEKDYVDYYRNVWGRKAWLIGPLSLTSTENKAQRGKKSSRNNEHECLQWLDSKKPNSVIYVCFGSAASLNDSQLHEIALGLEASGHHFIWVVKKSKDDKDDKKWLPEGFEERIKDKGLIIRGWAPQVLILEHEAIGAFITHCGWNSTLEAVSTGVPTVTWPTFAEQPFNEKLLTQVLKVGIPIGSPLSNRAASGVKRGGVKEAENDSPLSNRAASAVKREEVTEAVKRIMESEEALAMRSRAKAFKEMAWKAVEEGGSSYNNLSALIEDLRAYRSQPKE